MCTDAASDTRNYDLEGHVGDKVSVSEGHLADFVNIARGFVMCALAGRRLRA
jgi:hypothetical protein